MIEFVPRVISFLFLVRTVRKPLVHILNVLSTTVIPIFGLVSFLIPYLGISGLGYTIPSLGLCVITHYRIRKVPIPGTPFNWSILGLTLLVGISSGLTGYLIRVPLPGNSPIFRLASVFETALSQGNWETVLAGIILLVLGTIFCISKPGSLAIQVIYLSLFVSGQTISYGSYLGFILLGVLLRNPGDKFLTLYIIESVLTVGTLFTPYPINLVFSVTSIYIVWQISYFWPVIPETLPIPRPIPEPDLKSRSRSRTEISRIEVLPVVEPYDPNARLRDIPSGRIVEDPSSSSSRVISTSGVLDRM